MLLKMSHLNIDLDRDKIKNDTIKIDSDGNFYLDKDRNIIKKITALTL
jgi:hypothetical protein